MMKNKDIGLMRRGTRRDLTLKAKLSLWGAPLGRQLKNPELIKKTVFSVCIYSLFFK